MERRYQPDVTAFAAGVRRTETGGDGVYEMFKNQDGKKVGGAYAFPLDEWKDMTASVGMANAPWQNPRVQDHVASRIFRQLYDQYHDWRLVAVAWKAGERIADMVAADPRLLDTEQLLPVKRYAEKVIKKASKDDRGSPVEAMSHAANWETLQPNPQFVEKAGTMSPAMQGVVRNLKHLQGMARAQYQTQVDSRESVGGEE